MNAVNMYKQGQFCEHDHGTNDIKYNLMKLIGIENVKLQMSLVIYRGLIGLHFESAPFNFFQFILPCKKLHQTQASKLVNT